MSQSLTYSKGPQNGLIGRHIRLIDTLSTATAVLAATLLALGVLAVVQMVFTRYLLGESTVWQTEFTTFAITAAMLLGTPYVLKTGDRTARRSARTA